MQPCCHRLSHLKVLSSTLILFFTVLSSTLISCLICALWSIPLRVIANHKPGVYFVAKANQQNSITVVRWYHCRKRTLLHCTVSNTVSPNFGIFEMQNKQRAREAGMSLKHCTKSDVGCKF